MKSFDATLALGSNIGDRVRNIEEAIARLTADGTVELGRSITALSDGTLGRHGSRLVRECLHRDQNRPFAA